MVVGAKGVGSVCQPVPLRLLSSSFREPKNEGNPPRSSTKRDLDYRCQRSYAIIGGSSLGDKE
jgi:hypothetical protein